MKPKIIVTQSLDLFSDHIKRLRSLGEVKIYNGFAKNADEWLERSKGFDIICTGKFGLKEKIYNLHDVFISLPFVAVDWIDKERIKRKNISVSNCPGCNKVAVSEWIVGMIFNLLRKFPVIIRTENTDYKRTKSLAGKKITILGKGNVGSRVGKICEALEMNVNYFDKKDNLYASVKDAEVIVDCLGANKSTEAMLDKKFFSSLKKGSYFITVTGPKICDIDAMLDAFDKGILLGAAHDSGGIQSGNIKDPFYQKLLKNPKVLATPHIAFLTDNTARVANDMMIDNIEAWIKGKPINLI